MENYNHLNIEKKWQDIWDTEGVYTTRDPEQSDKNAFILDMFPYPSGSGLHVGHPRGYIATDVYSRMKRMQGYNVLHPMGWDAFGLPAENHAIANKTHPSLQMAENIIQFKKQLMMMGVDYDWSHEINTTDPAFYKWTQWSFIQMFKKGLAYESHEPINWCPGCKTGLANEDLDPDGTCERCGSVVEKKPLRQWVLRITDYADRLLEDLDTLEQWPDWVKEAQRNWIGKSEGSTIPFEIKAIKTNPTIIGKHQEGAKSRSVVKVVLEDGNGKILILEDSKGAMDLPGGGVEDGETIQEAAARELLEETEYTNFEFISELPRSTVYHYSPRDQSEIRADIYLLKYRLLNQEESPKSTQEDEPETRSVWRTPQETLSHFIENPIYGSACRMWINQYINSSINIFTTRADTLFGCTYFVLAPEHSFITENEDAIENIDEVKKYIEELKGKSEIERTAHGKEKTGVPLKGIVAINPANGEEVPVWIADYVLADYGTGAVMAVPAHDERDWAFAKKYDLVQTQVIEPLTEGFVGSGMSLMEAEEDIDRERNLYNAENRPFVLLGKLKNSGDFNGLSSQEAKQKITEYVGGKMTSNYKLKDWVFSRQRYWGEPIPLVHVDDEIYAVAQEQLPVELPNVESYEPTGTGESPLAGIDDWVNVTGYVNDADDFVVADTAPAGKELLTGKRETNTMPQWAGSSWYYLRYIDPKNTEALIDKEKEQAWMPVDVYVGGDHATRHLIYARFWHKFLFDIGIVSHQEPFPRLEFLGHILAADGQKISKRKNNGEKPDDMVERFGADTLRTYEMFIGPFEKAVPWSNDGMVGVRRFIEKLWRSAGKVGDDGQSVPSIHKTIKKVTEDTQGFKFNTAVAQMMICVNEMDKLQTISRQDFTSFLRILAPYAPHVTEEIWREVLGNTSTVHLESWPTYDEAKTQDDTVTIGIQVNGKVRADIELSKDADQKEVEEKVLALEEVQKWIDGKELKKFIYVPGRIISIVTL